MSRSSSRRLSIVRRCGWVVSVLALAGCTTLVTPASSSAVSVVATPVATTTVNGVTVPVATGIDSTTNFGASITCGVGATSPSYGYAALLDAAIGAPSSNLCRTGDQAADTARIWVYPNAVPTSTGHQLYTLLVGTNDANNCGPSAGCLANWYNSLEASIAWLALPATDKIAAANAALRTGAWTADNATGVAGLATASAGASLSFAVGQTVAGHRLYLAYRVYDSAASNPGTASVKVDGMQAATLSSAPGTGHALATANGTADTIFVASVPLGAAGSHTVQVTATSTGGGTFALQWVGVASANDAGNGASVDSGNQAAPRVIVGQITQSESTALNTVIASYNAQLSAMVDALQADGMNVVVAPTGSVLNIAIDMNDELHPNNAGHLLVANAFASAL